MDTLRNHNHMLKSELDRVRSSLSHVSENHCKSLQVIIFLQEPSLASTTRLSTIGIMSLVINFYVCVHHF